MSILLIACGVCGYFLAKNDFPLALLVLGLVLGLRGKKVIVNKEG